MRLEELDRICLHLEQVQLPFFVKPILNIQPIARPYPGILRLDLLRNYLPRLPQALIVLVVIVWDFYGDGSERFVGAAKHHLVFVDLSRGLVNLLLEQPANGVLVHAVDLQPAVDLPAVLLPADVFVRDEFEIAELEGPGGLEHRLGELGFDFWDILFGYVEAYACSDRFQATVDFLEVCAHLKQENSWSVLVSVIHYEKLW